jgi:hypothetical protein
MLSNFRMSGKPPPMSQRRLSQSVVVVDVLGAPTSLSSLFSREPAFALARTHEKRDFPTSQASR